MDPVAEEPGGGQELAEENLLPQRRDRGVRILLDMETPDVGADGQWTVENLVDRSGARIKHLALPVGGQGSDLQRHASFQQPLASTGTPLNCILK